jgi:hypothetical protein
VDASEDITASKKLKGLTYTIGFLDGENNDNTSLKCIFEDIPDGIFKTKLPASSDWRIWRTSSSEDSRGGRIKPEPILKMKSSNKICVKISKHASDGDDGDDAHQHHHRVKMDFRIIGFKFASFETNQELKVLG